MMYEESLQTRKIVGAIDAGRDLVEALTQVCDEREVHGAEIRAVGTLRDVTLARFDAATKSWVTTAQGEGPFEIVSLSGNVSTLGDQTIVRADALLAVAAPGGQQLAFGQVQSAEVVSCEFVVDAFADLEITRKLDPASKRLSLASVTRAAGDSVAAKPAPAPTPEATSKPEPKAEPKPAPTPDPKPEPTPEPKSESKPEPKPEAKSEGANAWAAAAKASDKIPAERERTKRELPKKKEAPDVEEIYGDYDFNTPILGAGDILNHPKLGRCRVIKVEDDEYAHIRMSRGQIRKLALSIVDVEFVEEDEDGRNIFKVIIRR